MANSQMSEPTSTFTPTPSFKICLVGDGGVGKTSYVRRLLTGDFVTKYVATLGLFVNPLNLVTNKGPIRFNIWDCAGQHHFRGLGDGYYIKSDAFIVMWDDSRLSRKNATIWIRDIRRVCPNAPIVLVANKVDKANIAKTQLQTIGDHELVLISTRSCHNFDKPIQALLTKLMGEDYILDCVGDVGDVGEVIGNGDQEEEEIRAKLEAKRVELEREAYNKVAIYEGQVYDEVGEELTRFEEGVRSGA